MLCTTEIIPIDEERHGRQAGWAEIKRIFIRYIFEKGTCRCLESRNAVREITVEGPLRPHSVRVLGENSGQGCSTILDFSDPFNVLVLTLATVSLLSQSPSLEMHALLPHPNSVPECRWHVWESSWVVAACRCVSIIASMSSDAVRPSVRGEALPAELVTAATARYVIAPRILVQADCAIWAPLRDLSDLLLRSLVLLHLLLLQCHTVKISLASLSLMHWYFAGDTVPVLAHLASEDIAVFFR